MTQLTQYPLIPSQEDCVCTGLDAISQAISNISSVAGPAGADGTDGATPYIGGNGNWWIDGIDTGVAATGPQGPQGETGPAGATGGDGYTPWIGGNGNWWIYEQTPEGDVFSTDTGVAATGPQGPQGPQGETGPQGPQGEGWMNGHRYVMFHKIENFALQGGYVWNGCNGLDGPIELIESGPVIGAIHEMGGMINLTGGMWHVIIDYYTRWYNTGTLDGGCDCRLDGTIYYPGSEVTVGQLAYQKGDHHRVSSGEYNSTRMGTALLVDIVQSSASFLVEPQWRLNGQVPYIEEWTLKISAHKPGLYNL